MAKTFKDIEEQAEQELEYESIEHKKRLLKERIREVRTARKVLNKLEKQYQELLDKELDDVEDDDEYE